MDELDQKHQQIEQFASMLQKRHKPDVPYDPYNEALLLIDARWKDHADDGQRCRDDAYGDDWARDRSYTNGAAMVLADMALYFAGLVTYDAAKVQS
ncbi:hypothetical protein [Mycolicibacter arupensis]|jgi:hypothetical protein|uniref:Uncharacterized protein n=1 Tax=Mycolicibacter arupensis TaxID=342002 RepID=A0A5C7YF55_9MYCO|nr:hypothetical protein [Mycolicibacter arupensis]TXI59964.1 MAG: hypothetical protein E6Q54_01460 [Mycolicibacter arupensis]